MAKIKVKTSEQRLAEMCKIVTRRLSAPGRCQIVSQNGLSLYLAQDFLSLDECAELNAMIEKGRQPSTLLAEHSDKNFRTSDSCNLSPYDPFVLKIEDRICKLMGINAKHGETMQGQVYEVGQQFKPHFDHFKRGASYWKDMEKGGGQRCLTAMIYLNQPGAGGETHFPNADIKVQPRTGMIVIWSNMLSDGTPNDATLHEGLPVLAGTKYIVTKWFRERYWI